MPNRIRKRKALEVSIKRKTALFNKGNEQTQEERYQPQFSQTKAPSVP